MKRTVWLATALALIAAACGGGDSSETSSTTTSTTLGTTTSTLGATTTTTTPTTTTSSTLDLSEINPNIGTNSKVTTAGLGAVRIGMTPQEANAAAGYDLAVNFFETNCYHLGAEPVLPGVSFMVSEGTIARVEVTAGPVTTRSGARIGMSESEIRNLFPGQIEEAPHEYVTGGKYLIFVPVDAADQNFRVVWETNEDGIVTSYRAGRLPEVLYVEGCL